jgi:D-amino-acid dehydrogenase
MRWIVRGNGPPYIKPGTVPRLAGWLWEFIRHCNARDYAQGLDALARLNRRTMALFAVMQRLGFRPPRPLSGDEARDLEPLSSAVAAGLLMEHERHVRPESVAAGLAKRLAALGVRLRFDTAVTGLRRRGAMLAGVETRDDVIEADHVVIAAGAWTGGLVRRLGGVLPVQAGKGYSITTTRGGVRITRPVYLDGARVGCSPYGDVL